MTTMKQLQSDITTLEQSKRLLELGVPADSANHYRLREDGMVWAISEVDKIDWNSKVGNTPTYLPCWSVGRLMEIVDIASEGNRNLSQNWDNTLSAKETSGSYINYIVEYIADNIEQLDFSKLE